MKKTTGLALFAAVGTCAVLFARSERFLSSLSPFDDPTPNLSSKGLRQAFLGDSKAIFDDSDQLFLYSIKDGKELDQKNTLNGYPIVGRVEMKDKVSKANLGKRFYDGLGVNASSGDCFFPHHAIRAVKGEKIVDVIICFGCQNVKTYYGDKEGFTSISRNTEDFYNKILKKAGVPTNVSGVEE